MARVLWRILRIFRMVAAKTLAVTLALAVLLAGAVLLVMFKPEWVYNARTVEWGATLLRAQGIDLHWGELTPSVSNRTFWIKEFGLDVRDVCWQDGDIRKDGTRICVPVVSLKWTIDFTRFNPRFIELGPIRLEKGELIHVSGPAVGEPSASVSAQAQSQPQAQVGEEPIALPLFLRSARLNPVHVELRTIEIKGEGTSYRGKAELQAAEDSGNLSVTLHSGRSGGAGRSGRMRANLNAHATFKDGARIRLTGSAERVIGFLPKIGTKDCELNLSPEENGGSRLRVNCAIFSTFPAPPEKFERFRLPTRAGLTLKADVVSEDLLPLPSSKIKGLARVEFDPIWSPLFRGDGKVEARLSGVPSRYPRGFEIDTDLAFGILVPEFEKAVLELKHTPWAIPAPFHNLRGSLELAARGRFRQQEGAIPIHLRTDLRSSKQSLKLDSAGELRIGGRNKAPIYVKLDVLLNDVKLELPRLDITQPPALFPDSRIEKPEPSNGKPSVVFDITGRTPEGHPVLLISNLSKDPVPLKVKVHVQTGKPLQATFHVENFDLELFHRDAKVEHFDYRVIEPSEESPIDGKFVFKYTDYTIRMLLLGTAGKPRMILESDPPLPQQQLLSVLLFGQPLDTLDPDRISSVGGAQAAIADSALNLASLYLLASTPIQSVGYDPQTGLVSMKVRIAEGTSLNVGAGTNQVQEIGIRKRLGPHWTITTQVERSAETVGRTVSAFLEWALRY